ncbi:MAG TPA: tetratricopeptide repeat protein, partial [Salinivirgaceae bacterium]|nr:tetratricopeptide repeat protein [Salinivirgaceae bacterium]
MKPLMTFICLIINILIVANDTIPEQVTGNNRLQLLNQYAADFLKSNPEKSREYAFQAKQLAEALNNFEELANSLNYIGLTYYNEGKYDEAINFFQHAIKASLRSGRKSNVANMFQKIGMAYLQMNNYEKTKFYYQQAITVYEQLDYPDLLAKTLYEQGVVYYLSSDFSESITVLDKSIELYDRLNNRRGKAKSLAQQAMAYEALGNFKKALILYQEAYQIQNQFANRDHMAFLLNHIGIVYQKMRLTNEAANSFKQALEICESDYWELKASIRIGLGNTYMEGKKYEAAADEFYKALEMLDKINSRQIKADLYQSLYQLNQALGDNKKALEFFQKYVEFRDKNGTNNNLAR